MLGIVVHVKVCQATVHRELLRDFSAICDTLDVLKYRKASF